MNKIFLTISILCIGLLGCDDDVKEVQDHDTRDIALEKKEIPDFEQPDPEPKQETQTTKQPDPEPKQETQTTKQQDPQENGPDQLQGEDRIDEFLQAYSEKEIEYARVWLQVIGNTETDVINVRHIQEGEQVNLDQSNVTYPEDIIYLSGRIMASGHVHYSSNGDGSINIYDVPSHWQEGIEGGQTMEQFTQDIIDNPETIYIEPVKDMELVKTASKINIQN